MNFLTYFSTNTKKIRLVDKDDSWFMKAIAFLLTIGNALRITNIKDDPDTERDESFMGGYGTTIGSTVYDNPGWNWDMTPTPHIVHELTHILQDSLLMKLRYLLSDRWRMFYESEAVQAEILCFPHRATDDNWMRRRISQFKGYGIKDEVMIRQTLERRIEEVTNNTPRASAKIVQETFLAWRESAPS